MKKIIILQNNGGRLANQLWMHASVYAFCLEKKYRCENYAGFRYQRYFSFPILEALIPRIAAWLVSFGAGVKIAKVAYALYALCVRQVMNKSVVTDNAEEVTLPPTPARHVYDSEVVERIHASGEDVYMWGWLFRNPDGLKKYHSEIRSFFLPKHEYRERPETSILHTRKLYQHVIGVHIRQGDYKTWQGGIYYFSPEEVGSMLRDYLRDHQLSVENTVFVVCSDGPLQAESFIGISYILGPGTEIEDLYILSLTDKVIGTNSTFATWAAYYGKIPYAPFMRAPLIIGPEQSV